MTKLRLASCLFVFMSVIGLVGSLVVQPAEASSGKVTAPVLLVASRSVTYSGQFATLYAKVGVKVDAGTLTITDELGKVVASGPATQTLIVRLDDPSCLYAGPCTPVGVHHYMAHYSGSTNFNGARSPEVTVDSELCIPNLILYPSDNPAPAGKAVSFYAAVPRCYAFGARRYIYMPSGTVTFYDGSTDIGEAQIPPFYSAKITVGGLTPGSHTITAVYSGDANYEPGTTSITEVVG